MSGIGYKLDLLLEMNGEPVSNSLDSILDITKQLDEVRQKVVDLQNKLYMATDRLNGDLAMGVRKRLPGLNVGLDKNGCKVGYKSKNLSFSPDLKIGVWGVKSPDHRFCRRFARNNGPSLALTSSIAPLVDAISDYFSGHYKSLGEDIKGTGALIVEGSEATILDVAEWQDKNSWQKIANE
jgi:hypothetical protein